MSPRIDRVSLLEAVDKLHPLALAVVLCATGLCVLAGLKARDVASQLHVTKGPAKQPTATVARQYYTPAQYVQTAARLSRGHPGVQIEPGKDGASLRIAIADGAQYSAWLFALYALQGPERGLAWEAESICLGGCADGAAATATVKAYIQTLRTAP